MKMQGSSKKHDLSPGGDSQLPNKKLRIENSFTAADSSGIMDSSLNNSMTKNYLSRMSLPANDSTTSLERTYGNFHRRSFTKPIGYIEKQASDRFGPYSMRPPRKLSSPLIIRAKQTQKDSDPQVTTTAQKIIETLARMSTPVANAQKVPIDSIKPLKPSFTNLRRNIDYGGPPILRSPLVPSSAKIVSSPALNNSMPMRSIPKLVDSATNTDHINHLDTPRYDDTEKHTGGGKIRRTMNRMHPSAPRNPSNNSEVPITNSLMNHVHDKSDFSFGASWSVEDVMDAIITSENSKEEVKNNDEHNNKDAKAGKATVNEVKSAEKPKTWKCPGCFVFNKEEITECICCKEKKPNSSVGNSPKPCSVASSSTTPAAPITTAPPLSALFNTKKWSCPTCMADNKVDAPECVCCTEKNPNVKSVPATSVATLPTPSSAFKFGAPAATTSSTSTTSTFTFGSNTTANQPKKEEVKTSSQTTVGAKKWTCPSCWTQNDPIAASCPCCSEKNPNISSVTSTTAAETTKESSSVSTSQFTFGFGAPKVPTTANSVSPISVPKTSTPTVTSASSSPALENKPLSTTPPKKSLFGASTSKPLESSNKEQGNIFSGFKFTNAAPTASLPQASIALPTSSQSKPVDNQIELWRCDICPANNSQIATHCIACGSKKTTGLQKEAAAKKFSFAPFAGGRSPIPTPLPAQAIQLPKTSIFGGSKPANEVLPNESPKQKRKHSDDSTDAGFVYNAPEPKLKMKAVVETSAPPPTEIKTGSFMDAFKLPQPQQPALTNVFGTNMGGGLVNSSTPTPISTIPTTTTSAPPPFVFGSQPVSTTAAPFQFGAQTPSANTTFTFGSNNASKPTTSVFGSPAMTSTPAPVAQQPLNNPIQQVQSPPMPSFNMTPNLNFGVPTVPGLGSSSATPAPLFQFQANAPSDNSGAVAGGPRKIRRAMRRMK